MSTDATSHSESSGTPAAPTTSAASPNKGKGKAAARAEHTDDDDDEDDEDDEEEEDDDMDEEEDEMAEIDPSVILPPTRRTRGIKVDYTSKEALAKAGLKPETPDDDAEEPYTHDTSMEV